MIGIPLNAIAQMKYDQKHTQTGQLVSWVVCDIFNVTSILSIKLSRAISSRKEKFSLKIRNYKMIPPAGRFNFHQMCVSLF